MVVLPNAQTIGCVYLQPPDGGCARCRWVAFDARARRTRAPTAIGLRGGRGVCFLGRSSRVAANSCGAALRVIAYGKGAVRCARP